MRLGVTGTQTASCVTVEAKAEFTKIVSTFAITEMHHGGCQGGDAAMHNMVDDLFGDTCSIYIHQPVDKTKAQFLLGKNVTLLNAKHYLERNKDIVDASNVMIAMPKGMEEELRSGTWMTVRDTVKKRKPLYVVWPDGTCTYIGPDNKSKPSWWTQTKWPRDAKQSTLCF